MKDIAAGYYVEINTWENDGDYPKAQCIEGLAKGDVEFLKLLLPLFKGCHGTPSGLGNEEQTGEAIAEVLYQLFEGNKDIDISLPFTMSYVRLLDSYDIELGELFGKEDKIYDKMVDLLGYTESYEGDFYRVFESMKVFHFDEAFIAPKPLEIIK